jgi:N-methylhydantoinase A
VEGAGVVIGVDTGGTFTDVFVSDGRVFKLPSTPHSPAQAIMSGLQQVGVGARDAVSHGTTVATNAVLERSGARVVLLTTAGFEDVLEIRRQNRPEIYNLDARWPAPLVSREGRLGVPERLDWQGNVLEAVDDASLDAVVREAAQIDPEAIAICLLFSYANSTHEERCAAAVSRVLGPDIPLSVSHRIAPRYGEFERTSTTVVNAYVMPVMKRYLDALQNELSAAGVRHLHVMHSNGGMVGAAAASERPVSTVLSGPAAGVVGAHALAADAGHEQIITFDMGGTSTDVSVVPGSVLESEEGDIESFPLMVPMLAIETVGAGGGSIARVDPGGGLHVGPQSAGADPGPAAYGHGDLPTVTDANLVLGRLSAEGLLGGTMRLYPERSRTAIATIAEPLGLSVEQVAWAIVRLANSNMERAVRTVSLQRAYDPRRFTLFPFGGAGPLHAAELAEGLGIRSILVPPHPGVMAALGLTVPDLVRDYGRTILTPVEAGCERALNAAFSVLEDDALRDTEREDLFGEPVLTRSVDVRYVGQSFDLRVPYVSDVDDLRRRFVGLYVERYGYSLEAEPVEVVNVRVRATLPRRERPRIVPSWPETSHQRENRSVMFGSSVRLDDLHDEDTNVYWRPALDRGAVLEGPALVEQYDTTTVVPPGWSVRVDDHFNLLMEDHRK